MLVSLFIKLLGLLYYDTKGISVGANYWPPRTRLITMLEVAITVGWVSYTCMMVARLERALTVAQFIIS